MKINSITLTMVILSLLVPVARAGDSGLALSFHLDGIKYRAIVFYSEETRAISSVGIVSGEVAPRLSYLVSSKFRGASLKDPRSGLEIEMHESVVFLDVGSIQFYPIKELGKYKSAEQMEAVLLKLVRSLRDRRQPRDSD